MVSILYWKTVKDGANLFAPPVYDVIKLPSRILTENGSVLTLTNDNIRKYIVKQQDNQLFRQIRMITNDDSLFNSYIVFVQCHHSARDEDSIKELIEAGFFLNGTHFQVSERSASMTRSGILSFVDSNIAEQLNESISLGLQINKTVLAKWYAYRGLMLSSCHCLEKWYPKIVIVPDLYRIIPSQKIKYICDTTIQSIDEDGNKKEWVQKDISEDIRDIEINAFDGCGIHHPSITKTVKTLLGCEETPTSILWRAPFIKGVTHDIDYVKFFKQAGITEIKDIWGNSHPVTANSEPMIIMTESMYKGLKYFKKSGTSDDWEDYWTRFKQYNHCIGVAKWNCSKEDEPVYTRANYQILQDLELSFEDFALLAKESIDWVTKIIDEDEAYTKCFLGLFKDKLYPKNSYCKAILKNPMMMHEYGVRSYLINLLEKYINEFKCGKLWIKSCFKFLTPDLIMFLEHIGGMPLQGCLKQDEFFAPSAIPYTSEKTYLIERNPHICKSEHVLLKHSISNVAREYFGHLSNVCMVNSKSITPQRLNGADFDGDLVLVVDNEIMKSGVCKDIPIVIDVDDKVTVEPEADNMENKVQCIMRTMKNFIGEYSNYASVYHNKTPRNDVTRKKYEKFIDIISVLTGKSIDYAKTGIIYRMPYYIAKYGRPLPYFMKYRGEYYAKGKLSKSNSNMNRLCFELERWEKNFRWKRKYKDFDYTIMMDTDIPFNKVIFNKIEEIYIDYCKEMKQLGKDEYYIRREIGEFILDWARYYQQYKDRCLSVCSNKKELANYCVYLCYVKYPNSNKKFIWKVADEGVLDNIQSVKALFPIKSKYGKLEYLGRKFDLEWGEFIDQRNIRS